MFGSLAKLQLVWNLADVSMGLMAGVNLIAIIMVSGVAFRVIKDYTDQLNQGKIPKFNKNNFPDLKNKMSAWK